MTSLYRNRRVDFIHRGNSNLAIQAPPAQRDWRTKANCLGLTAEETDRIFYPKTRSVTPEAELLCSGCEVRRECDDYARTMKERWGTWAGVCREKPGSH